MRITRTTLSNKVKKQGYDIITANSKFYIRKDKQLVKWQNGFRDIRAAINFIEGHEYVTATIDEISWSDDDLEYLLNTYHFTKKADNVWMTKIDDVIISLSANKKDNNIVLNIDEDGVLTIKQFSDFDKVIETVDRYFNFDDIVASVNLLSNEEVKQAITAARSNRKDRRGGSSRDIARNLVRVKSSNIWAYGMDIKDRKDKTGNLVIQFKGKNGGPDDVYIYYDVPIKLWKGFISAPSKGHYFHMNIRNSFWYAKLTGDKKGKLRNAINR